MRLFKFQLQPYVVKHALSVATSVLIAILIDQLTNVGFTFWIMIAAFVVAQAKQGATLRRSIINFSFVIITVLLLATLFIFFRKEIDLQLSLTIIILFLALLIIFLRAQQTQNIYHLVLFLLLVLITSLHPLFEVPVHRQLIDASLGGFIGIICANIFFHSSTTTEFRHGLVPVISAITVYLQAITKCTLQDDADFLFLTKSRTQLEAKVLPTNNIEYPEWVYEVGFNPGLRAGYRYFLINLERVIEVLMAMEYQLRIGIDPLLRQPIRTAFNISMQHNEELLRILKAYFAENKITLPAADFIADIKELEKILKQVVPQNLELLDVTPGSTLLVAFIREVKDLRNLLLQLVMALPTEKVDVSHLKIS